MNEIETEQKLWRNNCLLRGSRQPVGPGDFQWTYREKISLLPIDIQWAERYRCTSRIWRTRSHHLPDLTPICGLIYDEVEAVQLDKKLRTQVSNTSKRDLSNISDYT